MPVIIDVSPELRNIPSEKGSEAPKFSSDESFNNCMKRFDQFLAQIDLLFDQYEKSLIKWMFFFSILTAITITGVFIAIVEFVLKKP